MAEHNDVPFLIRRFRGLRGWLRGDDLRRPQRLAGPTAPSAAVSFGIVGAKPPSFAVPKPGTPLVQLKTAPVGGRSTHPDATVFSSSMSMAWLPRRENLGSLETIDLTKVPPEDLVELLADANPEFSMATWNVTRLANSGWGISVKDKDDVADDDDGLTRANAVLRRVHQQRGGVDGLINTLARTAFHSGAVCVEAAPKSGLKDLEDIYPVAPKTIRFRWVNTGTKDRPTWQLTMEQWVASYPHAVWLNPAQVFYLPLDSNVDDPYGSPPAFAAVGAIMFYLDVLRDLRRALHANAFGRLDISVLEDIVLQHIPEDVEEDPEKRRDYMQGIVDGIKQQAAGLEPDDSLVHLSSVEVKAISAAGRMFDIHPMIKSLESLVIRGLKQLPTLMGGVESRGAAGLGTLEYQIYTTGINAYQNLIARAIELSLELALRLQGRQVRVHFWFDPIRTTDRLKDAQAEALEIQNASRKYALGYIGQDEASVEVTGHQPDVPEPRSQTAITNDSPSPAPMQANDLNPADGADPKVGTPSVAESTGEGGDQGGAPQPDPKRLEELEHLRSQIDDLSLKDQEFILRVLDRGRLPHQP